MSGEPVRHIASGPGSGVRLKITPERVGWKYLSFKVAALEPGGTLKGDTGLNEVAVIPLSGTARSEFAGQAHIVSRRDVFSEMPHLAYLPPRTAYAIVALEAFEVAMAGAPAEGRYPARLFSAGEMPSFVRGGANVARGVTCTLDLSFPAERLIAYEILTPSGNWSSWPPIATTGASGRATRRRRTTIASPRAKGFAIQRLYTRDTDLDVSVAAGDGDLVLVHEGYHTVATAPGTNAYYLNFLAGDVRPVTRYIDPVRVGNPDSRSDSPGTIGRCGLSSTSSPEPSPVSSSAPDSLNQTTAPRITVPVPVSPLDVRRRDLLGGLIHEYYRVAA